MLELCRVHGVYVISDEIHHDFTHGGHKHIPAATVGEYDDMLVTLTAPSKTFNLAGLKNSVVIIPDEKLRKAWDSYTGKLHTATGGSFGVIAAQAAWEGGRPWLEQVLQTVEDKNDERAVEAIAEIVPTYHPDEKNRPDNKAELLQKNENQAAG